MEQTPLPDFSADEIALLRRGGRVAIIKADFYHDITNQLTAGAGAVLKKAGLAQEEFSLLGALEIPPLIAMLHERKKDKFDIYVALGCVVRGETSHYDIVATESARGLTTLAIDKKISIGNGILTVDTMAQAMARADIHKGNKGGFAARAAIQLWLMAQSHHRS